MYYEAILCKIGKAFGLNLFVSQKYFLTFQRCWGEISMRIVLQVCVFSGFSLENIHLHVYTTIEIAKGLRKCLRHQHPKELQNTIGLYVFITS